MAGEGPEAPSLGKNRQFLVLFFSQLSGYVARDIYYVALPLFVMERTGSTFSMGVAFFLSFVPYTIMGPFVGYLVDHYSRRDMLLAATFLYAATVTTLPFVEQQYLIFIIAFVNSVYGVILSTCVSALMPAIVDAESLARANSVYTAMRSAAVTVGAIIAFFLISAFGRVKVFFACSLFLLVSGVVALWLCRDRPAAKVATEAGAPRIGWWEGLKEAVRIIRDEPVLRGLTVIHFLFMPVFGAFEVFLPVFSDRSLHQANYYTLLSSALSAGMVLGSLYTYRVLKRTAPLRLVFYTFAAYGLGIYFLANSPMLLPALMLCFCMGIADGFGFTTYEYVRQRTVEPEYRGRVFSIMDALVLLPMPAGYLLVGYAAGQMSTTVLGVWIAIAGVALGLVCYPFTRVAT